MHDADLCVVMNSMQQWHPDRWTRTPSLLGEAKRRFQQIQEAYAGMVLGIVVSYLEIFGFGLIFPFVILM